MNAKRSKLGLPEGNLTPAQHEIMEIVWSRGRGGATVTEIWEAVSEARQVTRTTVLNLVDRLEKRRWLRRRQRRGALRYTAAVGKEKTAALLAGGFVDDFFGGSATQLVMSLLGSKRLSPEDVERLREMLDADTNDSDSPTGTDDCRRAEPDNEASP